jgi:hypothetical protein
VIVVDLVALLISETTLGDQQAPGVSAAAAIMPDCICCGLCWDGYPDTFRQCGDRAVFVRPVSESCLTCRLEAVR